MRLKIRNTMKCLDLHQPNQKPRTKVLSMPHRGRSLVYGKMIKRKLMHRADGVAWYFAWPTYAYQYRRDRIGD